MGVLGRIQFGRLAMIGAAVAAVFVIGHFAQTPALADDAAQMSISVSGCSGDECNLDTGESFTISVTIDDAPDTGYVLVQAFIDYGELTYNMTDSPSEEVIWPDVSPDVVVRDSIAPGTMLIGGLTGVIPPLPLSDYVGLAFEFAFQCSDSFSTNNVQLLASGDPVAGTSGSLFSAAGDEQITPKVNSINVTCGVEPTPTPGPAPDSPEELPPTGSGALSASGSGASTTLWLVIGALAVAGAAGIGASARSAVRSRQE